MKKVFYIAMAIILLAAMTFNVIFAYSKIDCVGCATQLFLMMTILESVLIGWGARQLYKMYEKGKLDLFK
jgi:hypothetical protein